MICWVNRIRFLQWPLLVFLVTSSVWAADDPFVGKWRVNTSKSKLYDEMKIDVAGAGRYTFTFGPGQVDTVKADGSDQVALSGTTLSVTVKGPNSWEVVRKFKGRIILKGQWTLSDDGKTLNDAFTQYLPDGTTLFSQPLPNGSTLFLPYVYARTAGNSGFPGTWDSESATVKAGIELTVQPYEGDGLSFKRSDAETLENFELDGNDHPDLDPNRGNPGATYAARRASAGSVHITYKSKGDITGSAEIELSADSKILTMTERLVGQSKPKSVLVFDRE